MKPLLLDLYCGQGGASKGYADAGFEVVGVDIEPQPRYPYRFLQADALNAMHTLLDGGVLCYFKDHGALALKLEDFAAIHASPPCQSRSDAQRINGNDHVELVGDTRVLLQQTSLPYVIENVTGKPADPRDELINPVPLCGSMFGLRTYRHRLFETNWLLPTPEHPEHVAPQAKMGRPVRDGEFLHIVGNFSGVALAREIMGMPWANRDGLREAIPAAYAEYVGKHLMTVVKHRALRAPEEVTA